MARITPPAEGAEKDSRSAEPGPPPEEVIERIARLLHSFRNQE